MNRGGKFHAIPAEVMNHLVVVYEPDLSVNRAVMILVAAICLTIVYLRFTIAQRPRNVEELSVLNLTAGTGGAFYSPPTPPPTHPRPRSSPHLPLKDVSPC